MEQRRKIIFYSSLVVATLSTSNVVAQDAGGLDQIIVTAQKRAENINDVGMQIAAIDKEAIDNKVIRTSADLANIVPGLSYTNTENNTPVFTLRGVGFYNQALSSAPTVSVYVDEAPLPYSVLAKYSLFDVERVEVLKGPQGTLYGQNATGGAINFITSKPTKTFEGGMTLGYGNFNRVETEGYLSGPVTEKLTARIAGRFERVDPWQKSTTREGDENGKTDYFVGKFIADYDLTDSARFSLNLNGWIDKSEPQAGQFKFRNTEFPGFENMVLASEPFAEDNARSANWSPGSVYADNKFWQAIFRGEVDLAKDISLTSLSTYNNYTQRQGTDQDGSAAQTLDHVRDFGDIESFIQEVRVSVESIDNLYLLIGGNYENSSVDQEIYNPWRDTSAATFFSTIGYPVQTVSWSSDQTRESIAGFINGELEINAVTLKAGLRYTDTKLTAISCEFDLDGGVGNTGEFFYDIVHGGAFGSFPGGRQCLAGNNLGETINGVPPGAPGEYADKLREDNLSFRAGADWRPTDGLLVYANLAKGYKSGSHPMVAASYFSQFEPVTQESLLSYDIGFKATLFQNRLQLNGAGFYYDYSDKQIFARVVDPVFGILGVLQNIPKTSVRGFEADVLFTPTQGLTLGGSYTFLDGTIDEFTGINGVGISGDFAGTPIPFTPRHQFGMDVDYEAPISRSIDAFGGASFNYRSKTITVVGGETNIPPPAFPQDSVMLGIDDYSLLDLRAGLKSDDWKVEFWAKNVTNEYYWNNSVRASDAIARFAGMPRTYGILLSYNF